MKTVSRRDLLKTSIMVPAGVAAAQGLGPMGPALQALGMNQNHCPSRAAREASIPRRGTRASAPRFRLALPLRQCRRSRQGLRFRQMAGPATSRRPETFFLPARWPSTMATGSRSICPTTGPSSCRSRTIPRLPARDFTRWAGPIPATSVGWYRRVFELPAEDAGKRITIEFDGSYRETMVVLQRFLHRPPQRRIRSVQLRRDRLRQSRRQKRPAGARGCDPERWLVLRGRRHLPPRLAGQDQPGAREAVGHVRDCGGAARQRRLSPSAPKWRTTARPRRTHASSPLFSILPARRSAKLPRLCHRFRYGEASKPTSSRLW